MLEMRKRKMIKECLLWIISLVVTIFYCISNIQGLYYNQDDKG